MLTPADLQHYREEGYLLVRDLIPPELMHAAHQRVLEIVDGNHDWPNRHFQFAGRTNYLNAKGTPLPWGIQRPGLKEQVFGNVANHPRLKEVMCDLLGGESSLFTDQIGVKHGCIREEAGGKSYYHQDSEYWKIEPQLGCNCWIPTTEVGANAIALAIMPRSHEGWKLVEHERYYDDPPLYSGDNPEPFKRFRIPAAKIDFSKEILFPMKPGDGLFFTNFTWHRSEPNRSGVTKMFYAIAYSEAHIGMPRLGGAYQGGREYTFIDHRRMAVNNGASVIREQLMTKNNGDKKGKSIKGLGVNKLLSGKGGFPPAFPGKVGKGQGVGKGNHPKGQTIMRRGVI